MVVIVPGSKTKSWPIMQPLLDKFYDYFGVESNDDAWEYELQTYLGQEVKTLIFQWSGGISKTFSLAPAGRELATFLAPYIGKYEITLFGKSLGGVVAEQAVKGLPSQNFAKLLYVATPHSPFRKVISTKTKLINIYSEDDSYQRLGSRWLYFGCGRVSLTEAENISLSGLTHSAFNHNQKVNYLGKRQNLFKTYRDILAL